MKRLFSLILVCTMILALFSACSGNQSANEESEQNQQVAEENNAAETATDEATTDEATAEEATPAEDTGPAPELSIMVQNHPAWPFNEKWLIWDSLEQGANVKLKRYPIQGNWWETIPLIVASGDMPDVFWMGGMFKQYGPEGAVINLFDHLGEMPNFSKFIEENPDVIKSMLAADGQLYGAPSANAFPALQDFHMYREDIFKKNNIPVPQNYDEFYSALKKLKELYPDSTPWVFWGLNYLNSLTLNFDTSLDYYFNKNTNSVAYGPIDDSFKEMLVFLNKLYKEKLISQEFLTMDGKMIDDLITSGKAFVYNGYINNMDTYNTNVRQTNPEFTLAHMAPPKGPNGTQVHSEGYYFYGEGLSVSSNSKNKDAAIKFIDWLYGDEGKTAASWGIEGKTFNVVDGKKQFVKEISDLKTATAEYGLKSPGTYTDFDNDMNVALLSAEAKTAVEEGMKYVAPQTLPLSYTPEETEVRSIKGEAIYKYMEENITKFILGQKPLSEWDSYVEGIKKLGLDEMIKIETDAYNRTQSLQLP
ncbi:extracellular solute-binding protein [Paenibacillus montanisoli]|uniref:ABC transporter substrate-binding protein n=1 Tax=Paenibacillus montanisoli TaxID=2081970 RepID=A0A328U6W0_9BACL|nr:extracellular solute-binding protein [Paenibacillus montanisoli]RAP77503.1 hypothetical protein DL346_03210 [Paenibacillus montanisoli]